MRMSNIYQPLLIRSLVELDGAATLRQLTVSFVVQDGSQLLYYEDRLKKMPLPVLRKHGIVDWHGKLVTLNVDQLSYEEKASPQGFARAEDPGVPRAQGASHLGLPAVRGRPGAGQHALRGAAAG